MTAGSSPAAESGHGSMHSCLYEVRRAVVASAVLERIEAEYNQGLADIGAQTGRAPFEIEQAVSAWSAQCGFVEQAQHAVEPFIRRAFCESNGPDLGVPIDATLFVLSGGSDATHAHQDIAYKWNRPSGHRYAYTTWVALTACDERTGALRFSDALPREPITLRQDFLRADFVDQSTTATWQERETAVCMRRGDVVLFDACTWHSSRPFQGHGRRMSLAMRWTSKACWESAIVVPEPQSDPAVFGMDTSGTLLGNALRGACGVSQPPSPRRESLRGALAWFWTFHQITARLSNEARTALEALTFALDLLEFQGGRPAPHVWRTVRDTALPELRAIALGGAQ